MVTQLTTAPPAVYTAPLRVHILCTLHLCRCTVCNEYVHLTFVYTRQSNIILHNTEYRMNRLVYTAFHLKYVCTLYILGCVRFVQNLSLHTAKNELIPSTLPTSFITFYIINMKYNNMNKTEKELHIRYTIHNFFYSLVVVRRFVFCVPFLIK